MAETNWIPFKVNATELRKLLTSSNVFASFAGAKCTSVGGKSIPMPSTDEGKAFGEDDDDEIIEFSTSNIFQCKNGVHFEIHFYGDIEIDLLSHVYSHNAPLRRRDAG